MGGSMQLKREPQLQVKWKNEFSYEKLRYKTQSKQSQSVRDAQKKKGLNSKQTKAH